MIAQKNGLDYISFDNQTILLSAQNDPIGFIHSFYDKKVVLDEFQYMPELIPVIKHASDNLPPGVKGKFLLTGSADIFKSAKTQEALPGHMASVLRHKRVNRDYRVILMRGLLSQSDMTCLQTFDNQSQ